MCLVLLLAGCRAQTILPPPAETQAPAPLISATPRQVTLPLPVLSSPVPGDSAIAVPLAEPTVLKRIRHPAGMLGESVEVTPGRVWVGLNSGAVLEYDAASGALLNTILLVRQSYDGIAPIKDLAFDGQHLWAVTAWQDSVFNQVAEILVLDPSSGQVVRRFNASDQDPQFIGLSPGRVWTQNQVFDASTLQPSAVVMNSDATVFASDGQGGIWAGGTSACDTCPSSLYRYPVDDLFSAQPGPAAADPALHLLVVHQRLWVVTDGMTLDGYDLAQPPGVDDPPAASVDLSGEMELPPAAVIFDGTALWLLSSAGSGGGTLYRHDPQSGQMLGALAVGDSEGPIGQARVPAGAAFDSRDIWVLTALDLAQIGLPWTR